MKNNYEKAVEMGKKARKRAISRHDPEKIVNNLINIYKSILSK